MVKYSLVRLSKLGLYSYHIGILKQKYIQYSLT